MRFVTLCTVLASFAAAAAEQPLRAELALTTWRFQPGQVGQAPVEADWAPVTLPYVWTQTWLRPKGAAGTSWAKADLQGLDHGWYETAVTVPEAWRGRRILLDLRGLQCDALVSVGEQQAAEVHGPEGRADLTAALPVGQTARLRLWVTRWWSGLARDRAHDPLRDLSLKHFSHSEWFHDENQLRRAIPAGLAEPVRLLAVPAAAEVTNVVVATSVRAKELRLKLDYRLAQPLPGARWQVQVAELDGRTAGLPAATVPVTATQTGAGWTQAVVLPWPAPHLWDLGAPYLYRLQVSLLDGPGTAVDAYPSVRFGFREVWTQGRELLLNGHPARLRLGYFTTSVNQMLFFEGIGFNAIEFQPNPTAWYGPWGLFPGDGPLSGTQALLDAADEHGWAVLMPVPGVSIARDALLKPEVETAYRRDLHTWLGKLDRQNRPSILMWTPSMNTQGYPGPEGLGRQPTSPPPAWFAKVEGILHETDPTRLVFHHQGGQTGDVETSNLYLNFVPLAEQEQWFSAWSEKGEKPWAGIEHLSPVTLDFFKQGEAWFTEYAAIYLGDAAYGLEKDEYLQACERARARAKGTSAEALCGAFSTNGDLERVGEWTGYYALASRFFRGVNRAWRGAGVNGGWFPWLFDVGFGIPPGYRPKYNHWYLYETLTGSPDELRQRPAWANPFYDAYHDTMQPLLVYLGGPLPQYTAVEPRYAAGETAERSLVAVWDGPGEQRVTAHWTLDVAGQTVQSGRETYRLTAGAIERRPLKFTVPPVAQRTEAVLRLVVEDPAGSRLATDETKLAFCPPISPVAKPTAKWGLYDPQGLAGEWLKLGLTARRVGLDETLDDLDVLVIGPRALSGGHLPFGDADVQRGLRVLILEQELAGLERFGLRCQDVMPRYAFPRMKEHPVLAGLTAADFANWRGAGRLLPTTSAGMRLWPWPHGPHWGNTGSVASVVIETPAGFTPLLECEFDLAYSPLLSLREGRGEVIFSQLDCLGRLGSEPAATTVAANLLRYLDRPAPGPTPKQPVRLRADLAPPSDPRQAVATYRSGPPALGAQAQSFVRRGGTVFVWPSEPTPDGLAKLGLPWTLPLQATTAARVAPDKLGDDPLVAGIGPQLTHWRRPISGYTFASTGLPPGAVRLLDGWLLRVPEGPGQWVVLLLDHSLFERASGTAKPPAGATETRVRDNFSRLLGQLHTNLGLTDHGVRVQQMLSRRPFATMAAVRLWQVRPKAGAPWRWRGAEADGLVKVASGSQAITWLYSSRPRQATGRVDRRGAVALKVNGQAIAQAGDAAGALQLPLASGWNRLDAAPADARQSFRLEVSDPGDLRVAPTPDKPDWSPPAAAQATELRPEPLYLGGLYDSGPRPRDADPYGFTAW